MKILMKRVIFIILIVGIPFFLTGCFDRIDRIKINEDGSGNIVLKTITDELSFFSDFPANITSPPSTVRKILKEEKLFIIEEAIFKDLEKLDYGGVSFSLECSKKALLPFRPSLFQFKAEVNVKSEQRAELKASCALVGGAVLRGYFYQMIIEVPGEIIKAYPTMIEDIAVEPLIEKNSVRYKIPLSLVPSLKELFCVDFKAKMDLPKEKITSKTVVEDIKKKEIEKNIKTYEKLDLPLRAYNLLYEYDGSTLRLTFQLDGGNPPYIYNFFFNEKTPQDFFKRYKIGYQDWNEYLNFPVGKPGRYLLYNVFCGNKEFEKRETDWLDCPFCLEVRLHRLTQFTWPPALSFPIRVKVIIKDNSNPPKQAVLETAILEGRQGFPKPWEGSLGTRYWIEIEGEKYLPPDYTLFNLKGSWEGVYSGVYKKDWFSAEKYEVSFRAEIEQDDFNINGIITEKDLETKTILQARIKGQVWKNEISFIKRYRDSNRGEFTYKGTISNDGKIVEGEWYGGFESGKWQMKRKCKSVKEVGEYKEIEANASSAPGKITISSLTKNLPYGDYNAGEFKEIGRIYNVSFDDAWVTVNSFLLKAEYKIVTSNYNKGILIGQKEGKFKHWFAAIIGRTTEYLEHPVKIIIKQISYGEGIVESSTDEINKILKKELKPKEKQPPYFVIIEEKQYRVGGDIFTGKKEGRVFIDKEGQIVRDIALAKRIAQAAWVYENIVKAQGLPGSKRVSAILDTHKHSRRYELAQDILARVSVQAFTAIISGGATFTYTVSAGLTWRVVREQFANLKGFLFLKARLGLEEALSKYQDMELAIARLSPNHIDEQTAGKIKDLYEPANILELSCGALINSLMPKRGKQLVDRALKTIGGELLSTLPTGDIVLGTKDILRLEGAMNDALSTDPAFKEYDEKLNLAKNLTKANEQLIDEWAKQAVQYKQKFIQ